MKKENILLWGLVVTFAVMMSLPFLLPHTGHDFNLEINKGEFIVFVGSSGCGKSTTLRMIAGLENISSGDFFIDGERANEKGPRDRGVVLTRLRLLEKTGK